LTSSDHPHYLPPGVRLPRNVHEGDDGSSQPSFILTKTRLRHYHPSANTFIDLVDDPLPTDWECKQRLRLRVGSRKLKEPQRRDEDHGYTPDDDDFNLLLPPKIDDLTNEPIRGFNDAYTESEVKFWPEAQPTDGHPDYDLDALYSLLNPPSHLGNVEGTADERSLVYVTGDENQPSAIVFINFDPAIKLQGLAEWPRKKERNGRSAKTNLVNERPNGGGCATGHLSGDREENSTVTIERPKTNGNGKGKILQQDEKCQMNGATMISGGQMTVETERSIVGNKYAQAWLRQEPAMYLDIGLGYQFSL